LARTRARFPADTGKTICAVRRLSVICAVAALAGCGASDRATDATAVAERFHSALAQRDGAGACEALAEETRKKLEQQEQAACAEAILDLDLPEAAPAGEASVYVTTASVSLAAGGRTFLDESDDGWKVSASGCTPTTPDLPYDCELEG
jgi:hypothetical protein